MSDKNIQDYDESKIQTLSSLEHIRMRSGMYIGRLGSGTHPDDGIYVLLKEIIDNSIDEFIMGFGKKILINIKDSKVSIRDFGRGIPLGKVVECVSVINTGAKYNDDVFQFSVGLNGVGTKAVNALSSYFRVFSVRDGKFQEAVFQKGKLISQKSGECPKEKNGVLIEFIPDNEIFGTYEYNMDFVRNRLKNYAYLNMGLTLMLDRESFVSEHGLLDLLVNEVGEDNYYDVVYINSTHLEAAFTHTKEYGETYFSFVNGQFTSDGGTHLTAFKEGLLKGINEYFKTSYTGQDVREGIAGCISIKLKDPVFESQTKNKLGNTEIRSWIMNEIKNGVEDFLHKNSNTAQKLQDIIVRNEKLRKELNQVKKDAREAAKKIALKIPKLKDCKYHLFDGDRGINSMIFLTEGDSASGSMVSSRNVLTQAIFSLRGKPLNVFGKDRTEIYKNEEFYNMTMALGVENSIANLRYGKIIIATDADNDGFHIRNLLLTFFLTFYPDLVEHGKVYILETPLFRVRNKNEIRYCYNEEERNRAAREITSPEITRFKGLGEISPKEFGQFIGPEIKLVQVGIQNQKLVPEILDFYMGNNTPKRKDFIMENLI